MSACARCRWGPGTTKDRTPNTESAKLLESSLQTLLAARSAQDSYFVTESSVIEVRPLQPSTPNSSSVNISTATSQYSSLTNDTYVSDKVWNNSDGVKPQVQARTQLTSSMNWGAF